jgi:hypothetical protein
MKAVFIAVAVLVLVASLVVFDVSMIRKQKSRIGTDVDSVVGYFDKKDSKERFSSYLRRIQQYQQMAQGCDGLSFILSLIKENGKMVMCVQLTLSMKDKSVVHENCIYEGDDSHNSEKMDSIGKFLKKWKVI